MPGAVAENTLCIHVKLLDSLMTLAGELVLTRHQLLRAVASGDTPAIEATTQRVDLVISELQEAIMSTSLQLLGNVFHKFQRVVRDLVKELGKEVTLLSEGEGLAQRWSCVVVGICYTVSVRELYIKPLLNRLDRLDEVCKARQRVQGRRRVALDDGTHSV
jgi:Signal transducing histidine kinase, homodimeric domain